MITSGLLGSLRKADERFKMIRDGDRICVGLSGGKDSITLLAALSAYKKFAPARFELCAVTVDMGFAGADFSPLENYCAEENISFVVEKTDIAAIVFDCRREKNPCSLCSKMRRGALVNEAKKAVGFFPGCAFVGIRRYRHKTAHSDKRKRHNPRRALSSDDKKPLPRRQRHAPQLRQIAAKKHLPRRSHRQRPHYRRRHPPRKKQPLARRGPRKLSFFPLRRLRASLIFTRNKARPFGIKCTTC